MSMIAKTYTRLPWADRWTRPSVPKLLEPLRDEHQDVFTELIKQLDGLTHVRQSMIWYGASWRWTVHYSLSDQQGKELDTLCYLVPNQEAPLVCIPLEEAVLNALPVRRLGRFINDGLRSAKCAVKLHWAKWTPDTVAEASLLVDLVKRKIKILGSADAT